MTRSKGQLTTRERADLFEAQNRVLEESARGAGLDSTLATLCQQVESIIEGAARCSVLLVEDDKLVHGAGPSLPEGYLAEVDGLPIGPSVGSCGTAAHRGEPVIVPDVSTDPLWAEHRDLSQKYDIEACWSVPLFGSNGDVVATFAVYPGSPSAPTPQERRILDAFSDLAELLIQREQTTRELSAERRRLETVVEGTNAGVWEWNPQDDTATISDAWARVLGYEVDELTPMTFEEATELAHPEDLEIVESVIQAHFRGETDFFECEFRMRHKAGHWVWLHDRGRVVERDADGQPILVVGMHLDITDRKRRAEVLRRNKEVLDRTSRLARIGGWEYDVDTGELWLSDQTKRLYGLATDAQVPFDDAIAQLVEGKPRQRLRDAFERATKHGEPYEVDTQLRRPDGRVIWVRCTGQPVMRDGRCARIHGSIQDVTARKQTEQQLQQMRNMESLGRLAGGIAHDFNNILMGFFANVSFARDQLDHEHPAADDLHEAEQALDRAKRLTGQLLTFAKGGAPVKETVSLGDLVQRVVRFDLSGSRTKPVFDIEEGLWTTEADLGQLQQVFSNLTINAREAMQEAGHLYVSLENVVLARDQDVPVTPGRYIRARVRDTGPGIDKSALDQVFDPYFSQKAEGRGLGLATVYSVMQRHDGHVRARTSDDGGAEFELFLPATSGEQGDRKSVV